MSYDEHQGWSNWERQAEIQSREAIRWINAGKEAYTDWQTWRDSRTDAQIATDLAVPEADIAALDAVFGGLSEIFDFADNVASPVQGDRLYAFRVFS